MLGWLAFFYLTVIFLLGLSVFLYIYLTWNFNYWKNHGLKTARPLTIFGSYPSIVTGKRNLVYDIHDIYLKYKKQHHLVGVFFTRRPEILILDPKLAHDILVKNFRNFRDTITSSWINNPNEDKYAVRNPFWCTGENWKIRRAEALLGLTQNKLKQSFIIWRSSCEKLRNLLNTKAKKGSVIIETKDLIYRFTADVMCNFIWGIDSETLTKPDEPNLIMKVTQNWLNYTYKTRYYSYLCNLAPFVRKFWRFCLFPKETDDFYCNLTKEAIDIRLKNSNSLKYDFLNHLLHLHHRKSLSHDDIVGHSLTMLLDGYETVGLAILHALFYLSKYPNKQEKLRLEFLSNRSKETDQMSFENLMSLPYLDQCVNETLRLITLLPNFSRICTEQLNIRISDTQEYRVPEGMVVTIPVYSFHHDPDYFSDPESFQPERFDDGVYFKYTNEGIFLPFSDGPRICVGNRIALMTIKITLVEILSHFAVSSCTLTQKEKISNAKSFILSLDGEVMLKYIKLPQK